MFFSFKKSLFYEKERIDSFVEWPIPHIIDPKNLAKNVFFFFIYAMEIVVNVYFAIVY